MDFGRSSDADGTHYCLCLHRLLWKGCVEISRRGGLPGTGDTLLSLDCDVSNKQQIIQPFSPQRCPPQDLPFQIKQSKHEALLLTSVQQLLLCTAVNAYCWTVSRCTVHHKQVLCCTTAVHAYVLGTLEGTAVSWRPQGVEGSHAEQFFMKGERKPYRYKKYSSTVKYEVLRSTTLDNTPRW